MRQVIFTPTAFVDKTVPFRALLWRVKQWAVLYYFLQLFCLLVSNAGVPKSKKGWGETKEKQRCVPQDAPVKSVLHGTHSRAVQLGSASRNSRTPSCSAGCSTLWRALLRNRRSSACRPPRALWAQTARPAETETILIETYFPPALNCQGKKLPAASKKWMTKRSQLYWKGKEAELERIHRMQLPVCLPFLNEEKRIYRANECRVKFRRKQ